MSGAEVLVVGAGPTGLTAAAELTRRGARCRIVDAASGPASGSRAFTLHARTLEIFADLGLIDDVLRQGRRVHRAGFYAGDDRLLNLTLDDLDAPYPYFVTLSQSDTEALLREHLRDRLAARTDVPVGGVEWETEVVGVEPVSEEVRVRMRASDGTVGEQAFAYVVACDGAQSTCRDALNLPFPLAGGPRAGRDTPSRASDARELVLADVQMDWPHEPTTAAAHLSEHGFFFGAPLPGEGMWRVMTERSTARPDEADRAAEAQSAVPASGDGAPRDVPPERSTAGDPADPLSLVPTAADVRTAAERVVSAPVDVGRAVWSSFYRVESRCLDRFRSGRVFFAGSAAHLHSPLGGQGMNDGIQDAYNLAWKMALDLREAVEPVLLDSYDPERRPEAERVIAKTDRFFRTVLLQNAVTRAVRNQAAGLLGTVTPMRELLERRIAMLEATYDRSPVVGQAASGALQSSGVGDAVQGVQRWRAFGDGPAPGARAPDVPLTDEHREEENPGTANPGTANPGGGNPGEDPNKGDRLFDVLHATTKHVLLLFTGSDPDADVQQRLWDVGETVRTHFGAYVRTRVVGPTPEARVRPQGVRLDEDFDVLADDGAAAHQRYGARSHCLYLIRPDGHVGFRAQPAREGTLITHLTTLFGTPRHVLPR
jgi:2-polyprenyl-6-methoxyphenol hydroxylase-like FAD-dependent oxidoreductase